MIDAHNRRAAVLGDGISNAGLRESQPGKKERRCQGDPIHGSSRSSMKITARGELLVCGLPYNPEAWGYI
jgi:hypothetical protein